MSLADLRRAFVAGAPADVDVKTFFEEWLDRAGAPSIALRWSHGGSEASPTAVIAITQAGDTYHLPITIEIETARGTATHTVRLTRAVETFTLPVGARPTAVRLDPGHAVLRWEPEYGVEPKR